MARSRATAQVKACQVVTLNRDLPLLRKAHRASVRWATFPQVVFQTDSCQPAREAAASLSADPDQRTLRREANARRTAATNGAPPLRLKACCLTKSLFYSAMVALKNWPRFFLCLSCDLTPLRFFEQFLALRTKGQGRPALSSLECMQRAGP